MLVSLMRLNSAGEEFGAAGDAQDTNNAGQLMPADATNDVMAARV